MSGDFFQTDFSFLGQVEEASTPKTTKTKTGSRKQYEVAGVAYTTTRSDAVRAKIRAFFVGKPRSAETRAKISATNKGKISWAKGKIRSAEHCAKISSSRIANKANHKPKPSWPVMTPYGIFPNVQAIVVASTRSQTTVYSWVKKYPEHYYYIKEAK